MISMSFFDGFEKRAWLKFGPDKAMQEELASIKNELRNLQTGSLKGLEDVAERTTDKVFSRMEKFRDPKKMIGMGLALGAGLAGGALIGRAVTKSVGKNVPVIKETEGFRDETTNPQYGVNR